MDFTDISGKLRSLGYNVTCFATAKEASDWLDARIDGCTVGFGGSTTLEQLGLFDRLRSHNTVIWHWRPQEKSVQEARAAAQSAQIYLSSVNGLAETGEIINIDGACNRVSSIFYGHETVYLIIGRNKIAPDYEQALFRARNIAAPLNARRLGMNTPCAARADRCFNCSSPERICRGLSVLWSKPSLGHFEILLIDEDLGF